MKSHSRKKMWTLFLVWSLSLSLLLTACGKGADPASTSQAEKVLTIGMRSVGQTFDIHNYTDVATGAMHNNMFNHLFKRDQNYKIVPDLAEAYNQVDDTTWHFTLKKGVTFHNGDTLTAHDVKFTFERVARDPKLLRYSNFKMIKEVKVIDELNFEIITDGAYPPLLNRLAQVNASILPSKYIEKVGWDEFNKKPVGTGPYEFVEFVLDDRLVLKEYKGYFDGDVSEWDKVVFRAIPETATRVSELLTGGVQLAVDIPPSEWDRINNNQGTSIVQGESGQTIFLVAKLAPEYPTSNIKVRQAIDYAINDKQITEKVLKGTAVPTRTRVLKASTGSNPSLINTYRYDLGKAKQLMKEAGYENGFELTLTSPRGRYLLDADVAQMIAAMLAEIKIKVNLDIVESSRFADIRDNGKNKELLLNGKSNSLFDASQDMEDYLSTSGSNKKQTLYNNPKVDELINQASDNMNVEQRNKQYQQVQEIIAEEVPHIPLYLENYFTAVSDAIVFKPTPDKFINIWEIKSK